MREFGRTRAHLWWIASRFLMLVLFALESQVDSDLNYYRQTMAAGHGVGHALIEYPVAAWVVIRTVWSCAWSVSGFILTWMGLMLAVDLAFFSRLLRHPGSGRAARFWIVAGPALGPVILLRFDLLPAVLVAIAALYAAQRPRVAGAAVAVAGLIKYWPAVVLPGLLQMTRERSRLVLAAMATAAIGTVGALILAGWHRQFTPLTWQHQRGLEFEAVLATPIMLIRIIRPHAYTVGLSAYQSVDLTGPGVTTMITLTTVAEIAIALAIGYVWWRRRADATPSTGLWLILATTLGFIISDKVFSPQYMLWLLPVTAVGLLFDTSPALRRWALLLLATCVLTQIRYPFLHEPHDGSALTTAVETVRNLLVIVLFALALREAWGHRQVTRLST